MGEWPEVNGKPAAKVTAGAGEKIGLPNYSNVDIGPIIVTRFVEDTPDAIAQGLRDNVHAAELLIAEEREGVLKMVQGNAGKS